MKKTLLLAFSVFVFCFLLGKTDAYADGLAWGESVGIDKNQDGLVTYNELENWQRENLSKGYNDAAGLSFQMAYNLSNPYIVDIANRNYIGSFHYPTYSHRIISYYNTVKFNQELYPRETSCWFVTKAREDSEGVWHATVNCTSMANKLKTPETIYYDGHTCIVDTIDLRNCYVKELTLTDNITAIRCCQCPFLREVYGGINVERIDPKAFMNDVYLVNLPYFPSLKAIHEFAFLGCLNLKEVLLPPFIETLSWNAFGWMDCILGNYDPDFGTVHYEEDYEYRTKGRYQEYEKVEGITLYAAKDTVTYATLQELFSAKDKRFSHLSYKEKNAYPGRASAINLDEVRYALEWIAPQSASTDDEWKEDTEFSEPETYEEAFNSLTADQRKCMEWFEKLYLEGDINEDMLIALTGPLCGVGSIPKDFTAKHGKDEEYKLLQAENLRAASYAQKAYEARQAQDTATERIINEHMYHMRKNFLYYTENDLKYWLELVKRKGAKVGMDAGRNSGNMLSALNFVSSYIDYLNNGDSFEGALRKAGYTAAYTNSVAEQALANPIVLAYEASIFFAFGNSKAGDAGSFITTGRHWVELMTDLVFNPFYDAWESAQLFTDDKKWSAFRMRWIQEEQETIDRLMDTEKAYYGQNISNYIFIKRMLYSPETLAAVFDGLCQQFRENTFFSYYMNDVYDVTVKDNLFGKILYDWVVTYYSKEQDVLNKR